MLRFAVAIEGTNWEDIQDMELPETPHEGDTIETRYGTCVVTRVDALPQSSEHAGKIICRLP